MPDPIPGFPQRVQHVAENADKLAAELARNSGSTADVKSSPEYHELVRLKVVLQVETCRTLTETARISSVLERTDLAERLASVEEAE